MDWPLYKHKDIQTNPAFTNKDPMGEGLYYDPENTYKFWVPDSITCVLGASQKPEKETNPENILRDEIPVLKRSGGGGAVILSPSTFCYGVKFKKEKHLHINDYFNMGTSVLQKVLDMHFDIDSSPRGISDLCIGQKKILGCSLYMPRECVLYLASVIVQPSYDLIEKYLCHPTREPDYRQGRSHTDFITSISEEVGKELKPESFREFISNMIEIELKDHITKNSGVLK